MTRNSAVTIPVRIFNWSGLDRACYTSKAHGGLEFILAIHYKLLLALNQARGGSFSMLLWDDIGRGTDALRGSLGSDVSRQPL